MPVTGGPTADFQRSRLFVPISLEAGKPGSGGDVTYPAVVIREGVYVPGIGNPEGFRIRMTKEFLGKLAKNFTSGVVDVGHSHAAEDIAGEMANVHMDGANLRSDLVVQKKQKGYEKAIQAVQAKLDAGKVPNVSVELEDLLLSDATSAEDLKTFDLDLREARLTGVGIVDEGACNDASGCGIGMTAMSLAAVIAPPGSPTFTNEPWQAPTFADFDNDLPTARPHFLVEMTSPPTAFADLKFPYREAGGDVNLNALRAILGSRGSSANIPANVKDQAQAAARRLLEEGNKTLGAAAFLTVLALQGIDTKEDDKAMCKEQEAQLASLQAKVTALEADAKTKDTERAALAKQVTDLSASVAEFEKEGREALLQAVKDAAPTGFDVEAKLGKDPSEEALTAALAAFQSMPKAPAAPAAKGAGTGRFSAATTRTAAGTRDPKVAEARKVALAARYAEIGLAPADKSKVPASMRRNTDALLAPAEGAAPAQ